MITREFEMKLVQYFETIQALPLDKQIVVFDFIEFLAARNPVLNERWTNADFSQMSMSQAMRGMEDET
jgi:hypothetical protein